ncbi:RxLR effector protein [Phytophthora megakarya]|uniref:RxLR effector protein n=1 Tax=Phytophthora megakarya TaxID=4795 RepID=A0A225UKX7_9STRA|nr:RxLR effector protein [Phytophthora megakarya]
MKFWLFRGTTPEEVSKKLKVTSKTDKADLNYRYFVRYYFYFRYYVKYPSKIPMNLPKKGVDNIMKARLYDWINKNRSPAQVFKELGFTGTFESARGKPYYEYFEQYFNKWRDLQIRLSKPPPKLQINL